MADGGYQGAAELYATSPAPIKDYRNKPLPRGVNNDRLTEWLAQVKTDPDSYS